MSTTAWLIVTATAAVVVYLLVMLGFYLRSREADKHIDYSKVRKWQDEDD